MPYLLFCLGSVNPGWPAAGAFVTAGRIQVADLCKSYGRTLALADVNLTLAAGRLHALVGENGAGKSTLLHMLAGLLKPSRGTCTVDGQHVYSGMSLSA